MDELAFRSETYQVQKFKSRWNNEVLRLCRAGKARRLSEAEVIVLFSF